MNIGLRIIDLLNEKNINITDFAALLGVSLKIIEEWRRGNFDPTTTQVVKISEYLNVSCDYLLTGEVLRCPHCNQIIK